MPRSTRLIDACVGAVPGSLRAEYRRLVDALPAVPHPRVLTEEDLAVLVGWIVYEFTISSDRIVLQPILIGAGCLMIAIPLAPSMRRHYRTTPAS